MLSEYFFDSGLNLKSLKSIYPFKKNLNVIAIPIPYGPFSAEEINKNILENEAKVRNMQIVLRGDFYERELSILERQITSSRKVIGLKFYQDYKIKNTKRFLVEAISKKLLMLANKYSLILFIHTNNLDASAIKFLSEILKKYTKIRIVLTHGGIKLTGYYSYGFGTEENFKKSLLTKENINKNRRKLSGAEKKYKLISAVPRLYVNTSFIVRELDLYPIFKILALKNKIVYGSDLPFAYANRIRSKREKYDISAPNIKKIYEGRNTTSLEQYNGNLLFFLERIYNVVSYLYPKRVKQIFRGILYSNTALLTKKPK